MRWRDQIGRRKATCVASGWLLAIGVAACSGKSVTDGGTGSAGSAHAGVPAGGTSPVMGPGGSSGSGGSGNEGGGAGLTGGVASMAGAGAGGAAEGGAGGSADAGPCAGADPNACIELVAGGLGSYGTAFKKSWFVMGCAEKVGPECVLVAECPAEGSKTIQTFPIGGTPGQKYKVTFRFGAIASAKFYEGGVFDGRDANPGGAAPVMEAFHRGGQPLASPHSVWKLSVLDAQGALAMHYFMNSFEQPGFEASRTWYIVYERSIVVIGGGSVEYLISDADCRTIDNCGAGDVEGSDCNAARSAPAPDNTLMLPAQYQDPADGQVKSTLALGAAYPNNTLAQPWHSQVGVLTVLSVEETDDPVNPDQ